MAELHQYLTAPYVDGGRDLTGFDCWGQTRHRLHYGHGYPLFTSFGYVHPDDKVSLTRSYNEILNLFVLCDPQHGAIACGFRGGNLIHMGVCELIDGTLEVLHTSRKKGPSIISLKEFKRMFPEVKYYAYTGN